MFDNWPYLSHKLVHAVNNNINSSNNNYTTRNNNNSGVSTKILVNIKLKTRIVIF